MRLGVAAAVVDGRLVAGDVDVQDGRIASVALSSPNGRGTAVPGFVDLQVNGFGGVDFLAADGDGYLRAGEALLETGVTAFQPTLITQPADALVGALREAAAARPGARLLGVHLEGPFISPARLGTHPAEARRDPDVRLLARLLEAGPVTHMTLAPELPGALPFIEALCARGVTVALGHTDATAAQAHAAFERGATTVTHLFNAMRPFAHRDPGLVGAALGREDVTVQVILDGVHVADDAALVAWRAANGRLALVTDAIAGAGLGEGRYRLGEVDVDVTNGEARRSDGVLAGGVSTMIDAVRRLHRLGAPLPQAVAAASAVPARIAGRPDLGRLEPGAPADVAVLDEALGVERVLVAGQTRFVR